jgi:BirA family biotin operon repressor/biotin-[acetyl-CoA-carboxylase] ligase
MEPMATPYVVIDLVSAASTQDEARDRFGNEPTLVIARVQSAGRGRGGHEWVHAPRALATSMAFQPAWPPDRWGPLPLVAGLAARDAAGDLRLKWPNDLMSGDRKVGGILAEADDDVVVIGLGLNLWWPDPLDGAGALHEEDPGADAAVPLARRWAARLLERIEAGPDGWGRDEYTSYCTTVGREISWEPGGRGTATGIAPDGALVVETSAGRIELRSGEVRSVSGTSLSDRT